MLALYASNRRLIFFERHLIFATLLLRRHREQAAFLRARFNSLSLSAVHRRRFLWSCSGAIAAWLPAASHASSSQLSAHRETRARAKPSGPARGISYILQTPTPLSFSNPEVFLLWITVVETVSCLPKYSLL